MTAKKALCITGLVFAVLMGLAIAEPTYPMCGDALEVHQNCTMMTPSLSCTEPTYNLTNATGGEHLEENNSMELLNDSIYYFNFTQGRGDYILILCDGSTREVKVAEDENKMMFLAVVLLIPLIVAGLLLYLSNKLEVQHWAIKLALIMAGLLFIMLSFGSGIQITARYLDFPELQNTLGGTLLGFSWLFWIVVFYFLVVVMGWLVAFIRGQKRTDKVGKYGDGQD